MNIEIEYISPEQAKDLLSTSTGNRVIRKHHVADLASAMADGEWQETHQGIAIDSDGHLRDGHHRLMAVVASGCTVPMTVARGLPVKSGAIVDCGKARTRRERMAYSGDAKITSIDRRVGDALAFMLFSVTGHTASPASIARLHGTRIGAIAADLITETGKTAARLSAAPVKVGAIASAYVGDDFTRVSEQYRAHVHMDYPSMCPSVMFLHRSVSSSGSLSGRDAQMRVLVLSMAAFAEQNANKKRIAITDALKRSSIASLKNAVLAALKETT